MLVVFHLEGLAVEAHLRGKNQAAEPSHLISLRWTSAFEVLFPKELPLRGAKLALPDLWERGS